MGGINRRKGGVGGHPRGPHHPRARRAGGRAQAWCGGSLARLRLSFRLRGRVGEIGTSVDFRPIPRIFPEQLFWNTKTAENMNWHCGILLIG